MTRRNFIIGVGAIILVGIVLFLGQNMMRAKTQAQAIVDSHFAALATNGVEQALGMYSQRFFAKTPRDEWARFLTNANHKWGESKEHTILGWKTSVYPTKIIVRLHYKVTYSGNTTFEEFTVSMDRKDTGRIDGHVISSSTLLSP